MPTATPQVKRLRDFARNSRRNLRGDVGRKRGESNFLRAFERAYFARAKTSGVAAGEFALSGYGIADLVWIATPDPVGGEDFSAVSLEKILRRRHLHAFEAKLKDWRRALRQAFRYRYFADKAIVVMPEENARNAVANLPHFCEQQVGLWTFDRDTTRIREHFTPTRVKPFNADARSKAIALLSSKLDFRKLGEEPHSTVH